MLVLEYIRRVNICVKCKTERGINYRHKMLPFHVDERYIRLNITTTNFVALDRCKLSVTNVIPLWIPIVSGALKMHAQLVC